jgi:hypothetical protein
VLNIFRGGRPDITPAQAIGALFAVIAPICVLAGVDLGAAQQDALEQLKLVGLGLFGADAAIRIGRNYADGKTQAAAHIAAAQSMPLDPGDPPIEDLDADSVPDDELPPDEQEFAAPPPELGHNPDAPPS